MALTTMIVFDVANHNVNTPPSYLQRAGLNSLVATLVGQHAELCCLDLWRLGKSGRDIFF